MTIADRIRAMSDDDLADFIALIYASVEMQIARNGKRTDATIAGIGAGVHKEMKAYWQNELKKETDGGDEA